jgi:hypothetical protein
MGIGCVAVGDAGPVAGIYLDFWDAIEEAALGDSEHGASTDVVCARFASSLVAESAGPLAVADYCVVRHGELSCECRYGCLAELDGGFGA